MGPQTLITIICLLSSTFLCLSQPTEEIITPDDANEPSKEDGSVSIPKIYEMKIFTNVSNRFAKTLITSKVKNLDSQAREATFSVVIPEKAFISGFTMEIGGKSYDAYVQEKEQAKQTYDTAVASGQAAGHVSVSARDSNRFTVNVNIEPKSKAIFYLNYEELLQRENDKYSIVINIHPGQPVKDLHVEVHIDETRPLKFVKAPPLRSGNEIAKNDEKLDPKADVEIFNKTSAVVKFSPDIEKQKQFAKNLGTDEDDGLAGQFVVQYDVERDPQGGEVLVDGGYFVHFFAPSDLQALPKQVIFVLDTSGSMMGIRIRQLKEAMHSILFELKKEDVFSIVEFNSIAKVWNIDQTAVQYESGIDQFQYYVNNNEEDVFTNRTQQSIPPAYPATEENIKKGNAVVDKLRALGGTDILSALKVAIQLVETNLKNDKKHQPIIIFLTDGEPTVGVTNTNKIISTIGELNGVQAPIFSLSFGDGADRQFLQKISLKNLGFARHIYEGADASLQLEEFYKQISSPLLSNVSFKYVSNVSDVTKKVFPILFSGSEIIVAGQIDPGFYPPAVQGWGVRGPVELVPVVEKSVNSLERLWAYLTLKQILEQRDAADNKTGPTQEALRVALKYSFVSDVSSLVVVKPDSKAAVNTEDASTDKRYPIIASGQSLIIGGQQPLAFARPPGIASLGSAGYSNTFSAPRPMSFVYRTESPTIEAEHTDSLDSVIKSEEAVSSTPFRSTTIATSPITTSTTTATSPISKSTTTATSPISTSTTTSTATETSNVHNDIAHLQLKLPWLSSILNENGTISISAGIYDLGINSTVNSNPTCPKSPTNEEGKCVLISDCPQVFDQIHDVETYLKYFCELEEYAGICCPTTASTN